MTELTGNHDGENVYFIGIGGVSMSALAVIAHRRGIHVGGSDRVDSATLDSLRDEGIEVHIGHDAANIAGYDTVVYNAAIPDSNPELAAARASGLTLIYRADFLASLMGNYPHAIGVAGMHGKSTTSALISHLFLRAGRKPDILIGAVLPELGHAYHVGGGNDFIFEACEYKDSFLSFKPTIAVVLNIEMDHPDYFKSMEQIHASFAKYLEIPGENGFAILNGDDEDVLLAAKNTPAHKILFGIEGDALDYRAVNISFTDGFASFDVLHEEKPFLDLQLQVSGIHNVMNALAAVAAADLCGIDPGDIKDGIDSFGGAARRMEYKGTFTPTGAAVFDDFAHHPSEIKTTLDGAKQMRYDRLFVVYQPHTYSRTAELFDDFCHAFDDADQVIFVDIYAARETNTFGVSSADIADRIDGAAYLPDFADVTDYLVAHTNDRDMILVMGAGDISVYANEIVTE